MGCGIKKAHGGQATGKIRERSHKNHNTKTGGGQGYMKKCRCKCRRAGGGRAMLAPTAKASRDVQTVKECQDWLISEYDLEVKRLTAERDKAIKELEFWTAAFAHEPEDVGILKAEVGRLKWDKRELLAELRRIGHENEMLWRDRLRREQKGWGENG